MSPARDGIEELDRETCLELRAAAEVGRLAYLGRDGLLDIVPVTFQLDGEDVIYRSAPGSPIALTAVGTAVAFEIDELQPALRIEWSVLVHGVTEPVSARQADAIESRLSPWASGERPVVVRISTQSISGRRLVPHRGEVSAETVGGGG
jgi:uncharacterized protein